MTDHGRWRPRRVGVLNLWEFDEFVADASDGNMLLRGRNGTGKSKVLELTVPFLLDGDARPHRLDPFGAQSRTMRYNVLSAAPQARASIGYTWMEFQRGGGEVVSIGAGLRARASAQGVESWFFVAAGAVDPHRDFTDDDGSLRTEAGLAEALAGRGRVVNRAAEYRAQVNRALFGMTDRRYTAFVATLLQLRRPQLSQRLDPSQLGELLSESLPAPDPRVVTQVSEAFHGLVTHREQRETARECADAAGVLARRQFTARVDAAVTAASAAQRAHEEARRAEEGRERAQHRLQSARQAAQQAERALEEADGGGGGDADVATGHHHDGASAGVTSVATVEAPLVVRLAEGLRVGAAQLRELADALGGGRDATLLAAGHLASRGELRELVDRLHRGAAPTSPSGNGAGVAQPAVEPRRAARDAYQRAVREAARAEAAEERAREDAEARSRHADEADRHARALAAQVLEGADGVPLAQLAERAAAARDDTEVDSRAVDNAVRTLRHHGVDAAGAYDGDHGSVRTSDGRVVDVAVYAEQVGQRASELGRALDEREREVFEQFLAGEAAAHLRTLIDDAERTVDAVNQQLAECATSSGVQLRLQWRGGPVDAERMSEALRGSLAKAAVEGHGAAGVTERVAELVDYRRWFRFTVQRRAPGGGWRDLTRREHGTGSGGEKAVALHLPLFAAVAAHLRSADAAAPRLACLDEAFAGIDAATRGELLAAARRLDLDLVMTSHEEWGLYPQLRGLAIHHLERDPHQRGVLAERFQWTSTAT